LEVFCRLISVTALVDFVVAIGVDAIRIFTVWQIVRTIFILADFKSLKSAVSFAGSSIQACLLTVFISGAAFE